MYGCMTGSICGPIVGSPPLETSCGALPPKRTAPGLSAVQLDALNGPPDSAVCGQVEVYAVTAGGSGVLAPLR